MTVEKNYKFTAHTSKLISKANQRLAHISKVKDIIPKKQLKMLMDSIVFSVLGWGVEMTGRDLTNMRRLQLVQNVGMRILTDSGMEMSIRVMIARLKMLNMNNLARFKRMMQIRRVINEKKCPKTLSYVVMPRGDSRTKQIRTTFPNNLERQSGKSMLVNGLRLLNDSNWWRDRDGDLDRTFKEMAKRFLLERYDNGKIL